MKGEKTMEWIKTKDKMPEYEDIYLIVRNGEVGCACRQNFLIDVIWNNDFTGGFSIIPDEEVTHWMPLPQPPIDKQN